MMAVWKYDLEGYTPEIMMPRGARVLAVDTQGGRRVLWALVDPEALQAPRHFEIIGTGHPITKALGEYVGTFQELNGRLVWHVFEVGGAEGA